MAGIKLDPGSLKPVPGYGGVYFIHPSGAVVNKRNKILRTFPTIQGEAVELRSNGQRERVLVGELLKGVNFNDGC